LLGVPLLKPSIDKGNAALGSLPSNKT